MGTGDREVTRDIVAVDDQVPYLPMSDQAPVFCAGYTVWSGLRFADPKPHERIAVSDYTINLISFSSLSSNATSDNTDTTSIIFMQPKQVYLYTNKYEKVWVKEGALWVREEDG